MPRSDVAYPDGSLSWSGGVDSIKVTTLQSEKVPDGIRRDQLCWADNANLRDGGITQRHGYLLRGTVHDGSALFQGKFMYHPLGANPYEIWSIGGRIYKVDVENFAVTDLSAIFGLTNPVDTPFAFFVQGEEFLIIQAGDYGLSGPVIPGTTDAQGNTLPLFWDGVTLRRSNGITGFTGVALPYSTTPVVYLLNITAAFTYPAVAATVVVSLDAPYPGSVDDVGTLGFAGTFKVTAAAANTVTLETISSPFVGASQPATNNVPFTTTTPPPAATATGPINEIPAATCMEYYMGRIWYAQGRIYTAGDIVVGASGTLAYRFRDSILKVTENPMAIGGDGFTVPTQDGNIRALQAGGAIDVSLGQGRLFIFTRKAVYALQVPVTRTAWIAATNDNQPLQTVVQLINGSVNDRSIVSVNGDLYYQSLEPGIRSLIQAVKYFNQPGNRQISANEQRILQFNDRDLMRGASGILFNNYLLQAALPKQTPQGIAYQAMVPMDFMPISSFGQEKEPIWLGMQEGLDVLQLAVGDFGGRERAFAAVVSRGEGDVPTGTIELWEITNTSKTDKVDGGIGGGNRVTWLFETPAFTWAGNIGELNLKKLVTVEIGVDRVSGTVNFFLQWRPDSAACWLNYHQWEICSPKNSNETTFDPISYPILDCLESYRSPMVMPLPPLNCSGPMGRPANIGMQHQFRLIVRGFCRIRSFVPMAEPYERSLYRYIACVKEWFRSIGA